MNAADPDISRYLKLFTFLSLEEIEAIQAEHNKSPELRAGQKKLAFLVCQIIFGTEEAEQAKQISEFMFSENKIERIKKSSQEDMVNIAINIDGQYLALRQP